MADRAGGDPSRLRAARLARGDLARERRERREAEADEQAEEHERAVAELDDAGWAVVPVDSRTSIDSAWQNLLQTARTAAL